MVAFSARLKPCPCYEASTGTQQFWFCSNGGQAYPLRFESTCSLGPKTVHHRFSRPGDCFRKAGAQPTLQCQSVFNDFGSTVLGSVRRSHLSRLRHWNLQSLIQIRRDAAILPPLEFVFDSQDEDPAENRNGDALKASDKANKNRVIALL